MPNQFVVPQFIDAEDKILGPLTVRQFVILLVAGLLSALFWRLFTFGLFLSMAVPTILIAGIIAFAKVNGVAIHYFFLNLVQTLRRPMLRVWDKRVTDAELRKRIAPDEEPPPPVIERKRPISGSRLRELSLVVNTGGTFNPQEQPVYGQEE